MRRVNYTRRHRISDNQEQLLLYLHKYRFITSDLLAEILEKDRSTIYERLSVLEQQGYIAKQYDSSYRLRRRSATYCLAPTGIRYLKHHDVKRTQLHYKSRDFTEDQIDLHLQYMKIGIILKKQYPNKFNSFTKYQLDPDEYIKPMPHLILKGIKEPTPDYLIEIISARTMTWKLKKRINQHLVAADDAECIYPNLLLVAGNPSTERRLVRFSHDLYADFEIFITTADRILEKDKKIWLIPSETDFDDDEEPKRVGLSLRFNMI